MPLTGEQYEQLCGALQNAFDEASLEALLRFKLGVGLFEVVAHGPFDQVVFQLVKYTEQRGQTDALVSAACLARPGNDKVKAYCQANGPGVGARDVQLPQAKDLVQSVQGGLRVMVALARDSAVRTIVGRFQEAFRAGYSKFDHLKRYKSLHDCLHFLQFQYLESVEDAVDRFGQGEAPHRLLQKYVLQMRGQVEAARADAEPLPAARTELEWIEDYAGALDDIQTRLDAPDPLVAAIGGPDATGNSAAFQRAVEVLKSVVNEAPLINNRLAYAARELPMVQLIEAMQEIDARAAGPAAGQSAVTLAPLRSGLRDLRRLQPRLGGLVEEHFEWQWLDKEFARAEAVAGGSTASARVGARWPKVRDRIHRLCDLSAGKKWAMELGALLDEVDTAPDGGDPVRFDRAFSKFRDVAAERFFRVDDELRDLSQELVGIAQPLNDLLTEITNDGHSSPDSAGPSRD